MLRRGKKSSVSVLWIVPRFPYINVLRDTNEHARPFLSGFQKENGNQGDNSRSSLASAASPRRTDARRRVSFVVRRFRWIRWRRGGAKCAARKQWRHPQATTLQPGGWKMSALAAGAGTFSSAGIKGPKVTWALPVAPIRGWSEHRTRAPSTNPS